MCFLQQEFLQLLIVAIQINLIEDFDLFLEPSQLFDPGSTMGVTVRECSVNISSKDANITLEQLGFMDAEQGLSERRLQNATLETERTAQSVQKNSLSGVKATVHFQCSDQKDTRNKPAWDHRNLALEGWVAPQRTQSIVPLVSQLKPFFIRKIDFDTVLAGSLCTAIQKVQLRATLQRCLMKDMMEFYRELLLLREFKEQNVMSLRKIVKKHRKEVCGSRRSKKIFSRDIRSPFLTCIPRFRKKSI